MNHRLLCSVVNTEMVPAAAGLSFWTLIRPNQSPLLAVSVLDTDMVPAVAGQSF